MRLHRLGLHGITLILAILAITCEISRASKQCKAVVMDVHMKKCRLGAERAKRGLERFDLQKYDEKDETKRLEGPDYSKTQDTASHGVPRKRQLSPGQISVIALPIVAQAINGAAKAQAYATSRTRYQDSSPSLMESTLGLPGYYLRRPYPFNRGLAPVSQLPLGSILSFGKLLGSPSTSILRSAMPLHSYGLNPFRIL